MPKLKIGLIGLGQRGLATLRRYQFIQDAEITALGDLSREAVEEGKRLIASQSGREVTVYSGVSQWRKICDLNDIDLVYICTDWSSHARMAVYAMQRGKHVALEVPAAMSVRECWEIVETSEQTHRHCTMLENCCYDTFHLGIMGMIRAGLLGDITHCEGAYIHDLSDNDNWMSETIRHHQGNPYPTHGLGPVCQMLDINQGDRLTKLVSMTGLNNINDTLIQTARGRSILIQFDENTPRPYNRLQTVCGTLGFAQKYPRPTIQTTAKGLVIDSEAEALSQQYQDNEIQRIIAEGQRLQVPNLMNFVMDRRLVDALLNDHRPDISVYDAALWSCITELSERSVSQGNAPIDIPDFTRGNWKRN